MAKIPDPIKFSMTVKEAATVHLTLVAYVRAFEAEEAEGISSRMIYVPLLKRVIIALEASLKKAGCQLDEKGWGV